MASFYYSPDRNLRFLSVLALGLIFTCIGTTVNGQKITQTAFKRLNIENGLSASIVTDIEEDSTGFIWISTVGGLSRFDGTELTSFRLSEKTDCGLAFDNINDLEIGHDGKLYIVYQSGWSVYDPISSCFENHLVDSILLTKISEYYISIFVDHQNVVWLATQFGIECYHTENRTSQFYAVGQSGVESIKDSCKVLFVQPVPSDSNLLLLAVEGGLVYFHKDTKTFDYSIPSPKSDWPDILPSHLYIPSDSVYYLGLWGNGLAEYHVAKKSWRFVHSPRGLQHIDPVYGLRAWDVVRDIKMKDPDHLLIAFGNGLGLLRLSDHSLEMIYHHEEDTRSLSSDNINAIYVSTRDKLYIGTSNGLNISESPKPVFNRIDPLIMYERDNKFLVSQDMGVILYAARLELSPDQILYSDFRFGGISLLDRNTGTVSHFDSGAYGKSPRSFVSAVRLNDHEVLLTSQDEMMVFNLSTHVFSTSQSELAKAIAKHQIKMGLIVPFGQKQFCVYNSANILLEASNKQIVLFTKKDFDGYGIRFVHRMPDQRLLAWAESQPYVFNEHTLSFEKIKIIDHITGGVTSAVFTSTDLWVVGTNSGLYKFQVDQDQFSLVKRYTTRDGLPANYLHQLSLDSLGNLWGGSSSGCFRLNPSTDFIRRYDRRDGLEMAYVDQPILFLSDSTAFCDDRKYLYQIKPDYSEHFIGEVYFKSLAFNDSVISNHARELIFPHTYQTLTASLGVIDHEYGSRDMLYYQLEGFENEWNSGSDRTARYTNLRPGHYTLKIKALNPNGHFSETAEKSFILKPALYQQLWFRVAVFLMFLIVIYLYFRKRVGAIKKSETEKALFNKRVAELELTALRSQMNPHFMFNSLNSIKNYILQSKPEKAAEYLSSFSHLIRLILQYSREQTITVQEELDALLLYIDLEKLRFREGFNFNCRISDQINLDEVLIPPLILQPFVENSIWHGLLHKEGARDLTIHFQKSGNTLECLIDDNGIGRVKASELKSKSANQFKSMGLAITKDRISILNSMENFHIFINIIDKTDESGHSTGTRVIINIPYENNTH